MLGPEGASLGASAEATGAGKVATVAGTVAAGVVLERDVVKLLPGV